MTVTMKHEVPLWMTLAMAAKVTNESRQTLWRRTREGALETTKHGRTIMVSRDALLRYMGADPIETTESPALRRGNLSVLSDQENS